MDGQQPIQMTADALRGLLHEAVNTTPPSKHASMTTDEIEDVVSKGVKKAFTTMGIDVKNPLEMQQDFAFTRKLRKAVASTISTARATAIGILVTGVISAIWIGIKHFVKE